MSLADITTDSICTAFAQYAQTHEAATIQRCWSTWNALCAFLHTSELIAANPMPLVGRPKRAKTLPKALPTDSVAALLANLNADPQPRRRSDWVDRDGALILAAEFRQVFRPHCGHRFGTHPPGADEPMFSGTTGL
jgi:site-specific recombinase XerD